MNKKNLNGLKPNFKNFRGKNIFYHLEQNPMFNRIGIKGIKHKKKKIEDSTVNL